MREEYARLPGTVLIREREIDIDYDVEEGGDALIAVARLRLPEKIARSIAEAELPVLDRPLRFVVVRGQRGAIRADALDELQEMLARPWSPDEVDGDGAPADDTPAGEVQARELAAARRGERRPHESRGRRDRGPNRPDGRRGGGPGKPGTGGQGGGGKAGRPGRAGGGKRKFRGR